MQANYPNTINKNKSKIPKTKIKSPPPCGCHFFACPGNRDGVNGVGVTDGLENPIGEIVFSLSAASWPGTGMTWNRSIQFNGFRFPAMSTLTLAINTYTVSFPAQTLAPTNFLPGTSGLVSCDSLPFWGSTLPCGLEAGTALLGLSGGIQAPGVPGRPRLWFWIKRRAKHQHSSQRKRQHWLVVTWYSYFMVTMLFKSLKNLPTSRTLCYKL